MDIRDIAQLIAVDAEGAPSPLIDQSLMRSVREFFRLTQRWRYDLSLLPLAGATTIAITPPVDTEMSAIIEASVPVHLPKEIARLDPKWRAKTETKAKALINDWPTAIYLYPAPTANAVDPITLTISLMPTLITTVIPNNTVVWDTVIASGALAYLKNMSGRPWMDREAGAYHASQFRTGCNDAMIDRATSGGRPKPLRTTQYGY